MLLEGSVDALIESASRRGNIPNAQMTYLLEDFLGLAQEELFAYLLPILHARREDYYLEELMFSFSAPDTYVGGLSPSIVKCPAWRLPDWAMASSVRDVQAVSSGGSLYNLGRITVDDMPNMVSQGWFFYGGYIAYQGNSNHSAAPPVAIRCIVHTKPNKLVPYDSTKYATLGIAGLSSPAKVISVIPGSNGKDIILDRNVSINSVNVDLISGSSGYEVKLRNVGLLGVDPGADWTISSSSDTQASVGDWIFPTGYTGFVPLPAELHPILAQRMVVKFLEAQGEGEQLDKARQSLDEMVRQVPLLIQPRAEGKPKKLAARLGLWRRWRW